MKQILFIFSVFLIISCNGKKERKVEISSKGNFYKQSEMAALMLLMYDKNLENKKRILNGELLKQFPKEFINIHTASLTDPKDRNASFKMLSDFYLNNLKQVFETPKDSLLIKHNNVINSCIACHKTTCIGPIPKIKKLLIQ